MSNKKFTGNSLRKILSDMLRGEHSLVEDEIPAEYTSNMGKLVVATLITKTKPEAPIDLFSIVKKRKDPRCQAGQILSNLKRRVRVAAEGLPDPGDENFPALKEGFERFEKNVRATAFLVDKRHLKLDEAKRVGNKIVIPSIACRKLLDLSDFGGEDYQLCREFPFHKERVPHTDLLGSGFFVTPQKIITAAHVLERAFIYDMKPEDVLIIRGHFAYDDQEKTIDVYEDQLYKMFQKEFFINERVQYGSMAGDMAWIEVEPYYNNPYPFLPWTGSVSSPIRNGTKVYVLGHGLGLPTKLSIDGVVVNEAYTETKTMFQFRMRMILPGNSGSPIFDAETHQLVGIVAGVHYIKATPELTRGCTLLEVQSDEKFGVIATHIQPFHNLS